MAGKTSQVEMYYRALLDQLNAGDRLPSERQVAAELDSCRSTIRLVLIKLHSQELLYPEHGRGYFKA